MIGKLRKMLGDGSDRAVKRMQPAVDAINALEPRFARMTDQELHGMTAAFRERLSAGEESLDDLAPEAFAAVREASKRTLGMRHFDVQLIGGIALHQGRIAEMRTGEGKTLVATLPVYLNALAGRGVHVITVNDYLAQRDASWMGAVYHALGVTVACLQHDASLFYDPDNTEADDLMRPVHRREAYAADITYGTNSEFGFDYLRDNLALTAEQRVQRELVYAIVDEVDYILIDEARTPLIISGPAQTPTQSYGQFAQLARRLTDESDFSIDPKTRAVSLTDPGITKIERALNIDNLYAPEHYTAVHFLENALKAEFVYHRDKEYVVNPDGEVVIVDEFTGRLMPGRRYSEGLHQAIEAKEGVSIRRESMTLATITLQNYFRMYERLAGMTGTASTEAEEFLKIYNLDPLPIPTNRPSIRDDSADLIYMNEQGKFTAILRTLRELHEEGRPVLVGTASIETSERLSALLRQEGLEHEVLNAKQNDREAQIVAQAGRLGAITVSTNMAGRGTDIILGGSPDGRDPDDWQREHDEVLKLGGLFILGTERHEARRIDNQLRGRAGRQGDPGASQFYVSLEDEIIKRFGGERVKSIMSWSGLKEDEAIENRMVSRAFENAQVRVEGNNFEVRKHLVEYDDVINRQRSIIYSERAKVLQSEGLRDDIRQMVADECEAIVAAHLGDRDPANWDIEGFLSTTRAAIPAPDWLDAGNILDLTRTEITDELVEYALSVHDEIEQETGAERLRELESLVMLQTLDTLWVQHLTAMEQMRLSAGLQAYGQRNPLVMYRQESHGMFQELMERLRNGIVRTVLHLDAAAQQRRPAMAAAGNGAVASRGDMAQSPMASQQRDASGQSPDAQTRGPVRRATPKIRRNDPCFCGSGLKYKRCHGIAA